MTTATSEQTREDWKHVAPGDFLTPAPAASDERAPRLASEAFLAGAWARLVFVGGTFRPELSILPPPTIDASVALRSAAGPAGVADGLDPDGHALLPRFAEHPDEGVLLAVAEGRSAPGPVQIVQVGSGSSWLRHRVLLGEGASAILLETHVLPDGAVAAAHSATEALLPRGAKLEHSRTVEGSSESVLWTALLARLASGASLRSLHLGLGGGLVRGELHADLAEPGAEIAVDGLVASRDSERHDALTSVRHLARDCASSQLWKSIARDRAVGSFTGGVLVAAGADGTAARQSNRNILLSREAAIHAKPQLEIWADDVKCSHGSATGRLDEKALFFLRSRGLSEHDARRVLVQAFAAEIVGRLPWDDVRERMESRLAERI